MLPEFPDRLDAATIEAALLAGAGAAPGMSGRLTGPVQVFESLASTSTHLMGLARCGATEGTIVLADEQTAGRGRFLRAWHSARGLGLWFSVLLRPAVTPEAAAPLTILAGLAVREVAEQVSGAPARLKWPNDVWLHGRKLAGILGETSQPGVGGEPAPLILGIGLNVHHRETDFPAELRQHATSLAMARDVALPRGMILAAIINAFRARYLHYLEGGLAPFIEEWDRHALWIGERVHASAGRRVLQGVALGLGQTGGMRLLADGGKEEIVVSGELELER